MSHYTAASESSRDVFKVMADLRKQNKFDEALRTLRGSLRRGELDASGVDRAGRLLPKLWEKAEDRAKPIRVRLFGQCTTSWLIPSLAAVAWGHGADVEVDEAGYDNVLQDLMTLSPAETAPNVAILVPWKGRLLSASGPVEARVADELAFWKQAWNLCSRAGMRILQVGYDWVSPDALGSYLGSREGSIALIRRVNAAIAQDLPAGAYFLDLEQVSGEIGRTSFYDMRRYFWTKQPFSEVGTHVLAERLWSGVRALMTGPKKVLVLDLDNTIWGGVVGEVGPHGVALGDSPDGEAFRAFQEHCKELTRRGILLAAASKNNPDDAREPFEVNPNMVLKIDDFAALEINWEPKGTTIARLAETLSLGLDSFVFFDDNPAEREQVRQALPDVAVVDVPEDPAEYVRALQKGHWFEAVGLTTEDGARAEQYAVERKRRELQQSFTSMDDYLRSLEMVADVREIDEADLARVVQLLGKTNQFNVTTRRHSREDVLEILAKPGAFGTTLRIRDRFGDHGLVGLVLAVPATDRAETLRIDTWLMSCRVIARTVEEFQVGEILRRARELGYRRILGEYIPTKKNALVAKLFENMGFRSIPPEGEGASYLLDIEGHTPPKTFVSIERG